MTSTALVGPLLTIDAPGVYDLPADEKHCSAAAVGYCWAARRARDVLAWSFSSTSGATEYATGDHDRGVGT